MKNTRSLFSLPWRKPARCLAMLVAIAAATHSEIRAEPPKAELIVPGSNIGKTFLGSNGAYYIKRLPPETASEAGMSQNHIVWLSGKPPNTRSLYIHTTANGAMDVKPVDGVTIDEIRITSPEFSTAHGIHCGSSLAQILAAFPKAQPPDAQTGNIYIDSAHGIAFEFQGNAGNDSPCIAITIFPAGSPRFTPQEQVDELIKDHPPKNP